MNTLRIVGVLVATTIGAGVFSLPAIFERAGWLAGFGYFVVLGSLLAWAHLLYWRVLERQEKPLALAELADRFLGRATSRIGAAVVLLGLFFALVVYLILGRSFFAALFPIPGIWALALFWVLGSVPIVMKLPRMVSLEAGGVVVMAVIMLFVFFSAAHPGAMFERPVLRTEELFLPFGPVLFSFAAWTAVLPMYRAWREGGEKKGSPRRIVALGTFVSGLLYLLFILGIFGSAEGAVPAESLGSALGWTPWKVGLLFVFGLFALWTSYVPIALEIRQTFRDDFGWTNARAVLVTVCVPLILVALGFTDFLKVIGLAGGVFTGLQYVLIVAVALRALSLKRPERMLAYAATALFLLAAAYEIYYYVGTS